MSNTKQTCIEAYKKYTTACDAYRDELIEIIINHLEKNSGLLDKDSGTAGTFFPAEQFAELDFGVPTNTPGAIESMLNAVRTKLYFDYGLMFNRTNTNGHTGYQIDKIEWKLILETEERVQMNSKKPEGILLNRADFFPEKDYKTHKEMIDNVWNKVVEFHKNVNDVYPLSDDYSKIQVKYNENKHRIDE